MPWLRFTDDFTWVPSRKRMISISYKRGMVLFVTRECASSAVLLGKAKQCDKEGRDSQRASHEPEG